MSTAFIYHPDYELHDTGAMHPETPARARVVYEHIRQTAFADEFDWLKPEVAEIHWVEQVHQKDYLISVERACQSGVETLDQGDTRACRDSWRSSLLATGGVLQAVDCVISNGYKSAFSCSRPPGHHARPGTAMGFCLVNHIAVAARYAQQHYGIGKVLIVDWDVHHGNGTQEIFYEDPSVFYFSTHQFPYYPGSGARDEIGTGKGRGASLNCPMSVGASILEFREAFEQLMKAAQVFKPELVLISAGFDAHVNDPLAHLELQNHDFTELTKIVQAIADEFCSGNLVSILEGGYNLEALCRSVECHVDALR